jgi:hypothetical protein
VHVERDDRPALPVAPRLLSTRAALVLVMSSGCVLTASARADVAFVTRAPADAEVQRQLAGLIDVPVIERAQSEPRSLAAIMSDAQDWEEHYVAVIDRPGSSVHVLRPRDQTMAARLLDERVLSEAPYAVALAIAELLEWLGASAHTVDGQAPRADAAGTVAPREGEPVGPYAPSLVFGAGVELLASPAFDPDLTRLSLEAGIELGRAHSVWGLVALRGAALGSTGRTAPLSTASSAERVDYDSSSLTLHAALGFGAQEAALTLGVVVGASFAQVDALARDGTSLGSHAATSPTGGLALGLRYPVAWGFALSLEAQGQWLVRPTRYRIEGREVLEEGPLQVLTRFGLLWEGARP